MSTTADILAAIDQAIGDGSVSGDAMRGNAAVEPPRTLPGRTETWSEPGPMYLPAAEWCRITATRVLDPDGWRRDGTPWERPITVADFRARAALSTCDIPAYRPADAACEQWRADRQAMARLRARCEEHAHATAWRMIAEGAEEA